MYDLRRKYIDIIIFFLSYKRWYIQESGEEEETRGENRILIICVNCHTIIIYIKTRIYTNIEKECKVICNKF